MVESNVISVDFDISNLEGKEYLDFMEAVEDASDEHGVDVSGLWF